MHRKTSVLLRYCLKQAVRQFRAHQHILLTLVRYSTHVETYTRTHSRYCGPTHSCCLEVLASTHLHSSLQPRASFQCCHRGLIPSILTHLTGCPLAMCPLSVKVPLITQYMPHAALTNWSVFKNTKMPFHSLCLHHVRPYPLMPTSCKFPRPLLHRHLSQTANPNKQAQRLDITYVCAEVEPQC